MTCPYRHDGKCNRNCRGFECRHREEAQPARGMDAAEWQELFRLRERVRSTSKPILTVAAQPLTEEQIDKIRFAIPTKAVTQRDHELARAIERAHGIGL